MWQPFVIDDNVYMLKFQKNDDNYEIYLTNFNKIWTSKLSEKLLIQRFLEYNPVIEIQREEESLDYTLKILREINHGEVEIVFLESIVKLKIKHSPANSTDLKFKIKYELEFTKTEEDLITQAITMPLVQTIILLEKQQNMMKNLLMKKDRELQEYQMEKGEISRTDLITEQFQPEKLISSSNKLLLNVFGKYEEQFARKYGLIEEKVAVVEVESWNNIKRKRKIYKKADKANEGKIVYLGETSK